MPQRMRDLGLTMLVKKQWGIPNCFRGHTPAKVQPAQAAVSDDILLITLCDFSRIAVDVPKVYEGREREPRTRGAQVLRMKAPA